MGEFVIETSDLSKSYDDFPVVSGINMNVEKGKIYGLLGRNGAGKTTAMCMILGLIEPSRGSIKLFGKDASDRRNREEIYKKVGSIIETPGFYPQLNAFDNLKIFSTIRGDFNEQNIKKVLKLVNLHNDEDKLFKNYSLGMKQRLGLAAALVHEPELLILDEPINGLDPAGIVEIRDILMDIRSQLGITVLISSHILSEIELLADEIGVIDKGHLIRELTKEDLQVQSRKKVIINVDNIDLACDILSQLNLSQNEDFKVADNEIHLLTNFNSRSKINAELVNNGIQVSDLHLVEENLEEYFMRLLGGDD